MKQSSFDSTKDIKIEVVYGNWHQLCVKIINTSAKPIRFRRSYLPWEWRYSMWVKAYENDLQGTPIEERFAIADPSISNEEIELLPGSHLYGTIDLSKRFPGLQAVLREREAVIFWSYIPELDNGKTERRFVGSLIIPKL